MMKWTKIIKEGIETAIGDQVLPGGTGDTFIGEHSLRKIWRKFYTESISTCSDVPKDVVDVQPWILGPENERRRLGDRHGILIFVSILVTIGWNRWDSLISSFVRNGSLKLDDKALPLKHNQTKFDLAGLDFAFMEIQYMFLPVYLRSGGNVQVRGSYKLPFMKDSAPDHPRPQFVGEKLKVRKVTVAPYFFVKQNGKGDSEPTDYAWKDCEPAEAEVMSQLRRGLAPHTRLAQISCSVSHRDKFSIMIDWADGFDLDYRLHTNESILNPHRHETTEVSGLSKQKHIICEMANLVDAVSHLHSKKVGSLPCYHMDLKPSNILVYHSEYPDDVVGRWKIADFGLSVFHKRAATGTNASQTPAKRARGEFQPPEADDDWLVERGRPDGISWRGDIWSLGAIMCVVLAYALNDDAGVDQLDQKRRSTATGGPTADCFFYSMSQGHRPKLKMSVTHWLAEVVEEHRQSTWVSELAKLIQTCLQIDAIQRPYAEDLHSDILTKVVAKMDSAGSDEPRTNASDSNAAEETVIEQSSTRDFQSDLPPHVSPTSLSDRSPDQAIQSSNDGSHIRSSGLLQTTSPSSVRSRLVESVAPESFNISSSNSEYKVASCPSSGHILILDAKDVHILRPESHYRQTTDSQHNIHGHYTGASIRWPYITLLAADRKEVRTISRDTDGRNPIEILDQHSGWPFSSNEIALSGMGDAAVIKKAKQLVLHDTSDVRTKKYEIPANTNEALRKVYFSLTDDVLLSCGTKHIFLWDRVAPTWAESWDINGHKPHIARCPHEIRDANLVSHTLIHFRQNRAFLVHNGAGFFGIFVRANGVSLSRGICCKQILCGAMTPNDSHVYYIRRHSEGPMFRKRFVLILYRREIRDMQIHDETEVRKLDLTCQEKTTATMLIPQRAHSDDLFIITSHNQCLSLNLTSVPHSRDVGEERRHMRTPSGAIGLGLR